MPELRVAVDGLREDKVDDFEYVDACVEHVHADRDPGHVLVLELVEESTLTVRPRIFRNDHTRELARVLGVEAIEELLKPACMGDRDGKDDGLAGQSSGRVLD